MLYKVFILSCSQEVASQATWRLLLEEEHRVDGRGVRDVRPIWSRAGQGCLPRFHGSALFTRGETQAPAVTTLGELHLAGRIPCPDLFLIDPRSCCKRGSSLLLLLLIQAIGTCKNTESEMVPCVCWKQSPVCCAWLLRLCVCHSGSAATALMHDAFF